MRQSLIGVWYLLSLYTSTWTLHLEHTQRGRLASPAGDVPRSFQFQIVAILNDHVTGEVQGGFLTFQPQLLAVNHKIVAELLFHL